MYQTFDVTGILVGTVETNQDLKISSWCLLLFAHTHTSNQRASDPTRNTERLQVCTLWACLAPFLAQPGQLQAVRLHLPRSDACNKGCLVACICETKLGWDSVWLHACVCRLKKPMHGSLFGWLHTTSCSHLLHVVVTLPPTSWHQILHQFPNEKTY